MYRITRRSLGNILLLDVRSLRAREGDSTSLLADRLFRIIEDSDCSQVILDLQGIQFITSDVIGQLIMLQKKCAANDRQIKVCGASAENKLALNLVRFDRLVDLYEGKPQAIAAFKRSGGMPPAEPTEDHPAEEYRKRAEAGDLDAQFRYGKCLESGRGVEQDFAAALKWYEKAARQGHVLSQYALGVAHAYGMGVPQDFRVACDWYKQAAEQGHTDAQYWMGVSYQYGLIDDVDMQRAYKWYNEAAQQGYKPAVEAVSELKRSHPVL
jgi:anti-anti-sigma regulatory factor